MVKTLLILAVAALNLAVMAWSVRSNKLVTDAEPGGGEFEASRNVSFAVREAVGKFKAIVCLNTFHSDAATLEPGDGLFQEIGGGVSGLFLVGAQEAQAGELINGGVLEELEFWIRNTAPWNNLDVNLYALTGIGHLLIGLGGVGFLGLRSRKHAQLSHDSEQAFRTAGVAAFL